MRRSVRRLFLGVFGCCSLTLTACQYRSGSDKYVLIAMNLKLPYWKEVQDGFKQAGEQYRVTTTVDGPDGYDPAAEVTAFDAAVRNKPAGILVSAGDAMKIGPSINAAIKEGIPVITVDSDAPLSSRLFFIGTNNLSAGRLGGQQLAEKLNGKGNVLIFSIPGQPNIEERLKGYKDVLEGSPGIKILSVVATGGDSNSAFDTASDYVSRKGADHVDAFVCLESASGDAVGEVLKRNHATDRVAIAMDVSSATLGYISDGVLDSTISQKPWTMGYVGLKSLDEASRSKPKEFRPSYAVDGRSPYPGFIDTGSALITKYNVAMFEAGMK